jgi:hypothetical protein
VTHMLHIFLWTDAVNDAKAAVRREELACAQAKAVADKWERYAEKGCEWLRMRAVDDCRHRMERAPSRPFQTDEDK